MQYQIRHEYNKTALPSNATNATTLQVTSFWDTMQIQVSLSRNIVIVFQSLYIAIK